MKNILFTLTLLISFISYGQFDLNGYKYVNISATENLKYDMNSHISTKLKSKGFQIIKELTPEKLSDAEKNFCSVLTLVMEEVSQSGWGGRAILAFSFFNCNDEKVFSTRVARGNVSYYENVFPNLVRNKAFKKLKPLKYDPNKTPLLKNNQSIVIQNDKINLKSENAIRDYFDENGTKLIEGIWEYASSTSNSTYRLAIVKDGYKFLATVIEKSGRFSPGDLKATFETAATDEIVTINWVMGDKKTNKRVVGTVTSNALIEFDLSGKTQLYKVYPKFGKKNRQKTGEWAGNGSGVIISKSGYIVTNHHVIEDADDIEVEFIIDGEVNKFNAEIVQSDKTNDLAIIKIFDMNFDGLDDLPYNFKTRSSDVGTKVYAYGYPMALSLMGKEIKITDGIISSKSGFDGDITTYQITAPIQGGNSGGPLFDEKGNFLGINSSGLRKDIADNVGYSIKSSYVLNLIDVLPKSIELPSNTKLQSLPLTEQIKEISKYVVLVKVK